MKTTEQPSVYDHLEDMSVRDILRNINAEDHRVPDAVEKALPQIGRLVEAIVERTRRGGRVFYLGSGTSGRLGILDASEIPPTYGVKDMFIGLIAGGDRAIRCAVESAEDNPDAAWEDMLPFSPCPDDIVIGIAASGTTPYVLGAIAKARENGLLTGCITCNCDTPVAAACEFPVEIVVGPEFVTGSTRMKSGTAQKLALNMISTSVMIQLGHVHGNRMYDMQLSNSKLVERGTQMIMEGSGIKDHDQAKALLLKYGNVRDAIQHSKDDAER